MHIFLSKIRKNRFAKSVLMITGGTALAQFLNGSLSPVMSRIYTPEEYGVFAVYAAILGMLTIVCSLKYEWGIPIAKDEREAINTLMLSIIILVIFVLAISIPLFFWGDIIVNRLDAGKLCPYRMLIPLGVLFVGLYHIFMQWTYRKRDFKAISKTKINQSISQNVTKILIGLFHFGPVGLILGKILGESAGILSLSKNLFKSESHLFKEVNKRNVLIVAKRYIKFPIYSTPGQLFNSAGLRLPVLFMSAIYGSAVTGAFGFAISMIKLPMSLIGVSIGDVFYGEVAKYGREDPVRVKRLSNRLLKNLILVGMLPFVALVFFSPFLFSLVFGEKWRSAGVYSSITALLVYARLIFTPISRIYSIYEKQKESFLLDLFRVILVILVFAVAKQFAFTAHIAIGMYSLAMTIVYLATYILAQKILTDEIRKKNNLSLQSNYDEIASSAKNIPTSL